MVKALRHHPSLTSISIIGVLNFAIGDDFVEDGSDTDRRAGLNTVASYSLARALSTISNLTSLSTSGLLLQAETFVELATKPSIFWLSLNNAGLSDEHILPMVETVMRKKGRLGVLDLSSGPATERPNVFSQEGWEALFRLAGRDPPIKVTATAQYGGQDSATFCLDDADAVQRHLDRLEIPRLLRLREAGFDALVPESSSDAAWIDVMDKVSDDVKAIYRVIRTHPTLCKQSKRGSSLTSSRKRKAESSSDDV